MMLTQEHNSAIAARQLESKWQSQQQNKARRKDANNLARQGL